VDLVGASPSVVETLHRLRSGQYVFGQSKSKRGGRVATLSPSLAILLREHRAKQEAVRKLLGLELLPSDLVFLHQMDSSIETLLIL